MKKQNSHNKIDRPHSLAHLLRLKLSSSFQRLYFAHGACDENNISITSSFRELQIVCDWFSQ